MSPHNFPQDYANLRKKLGDYDKKHKFLPGMKNADELKNGPRLLTKGSAYNKNLNNLISSLVLVVATLVFCPRATPLVGWLVKLVVPRLGQDLAAKCCWLSVLV